MVIHFHRTSTAAKENKRRLLRSNTKEAKERAKNKVGLYISWLSLSGILEVFVNDRKLGVVLLENYTYYKEWNFTC